MKEWRNIVDAYEESVTAGKNCVMATVVHVTGSAYRRPGAHMLIVDDGRTLGSISGGCLERDVIERAKVVAQSGQPVLIEYDTSHDDDAVLGTGSGCSGTTSIFIEPLLKSFGNNPIFLIEDALSKGIPFVLATIVAGSEAVQLGSRLLFAGSENDPSGDPLRDIMKEDAAGVLFDRRSCFKRYRLSDAEFDVFMEYVQPPFILHIFGGGSDAVVLAEMAGALGFEVMVFDHRKAFADPDRFPGAKKVTYFHPELSSGLPVMDDRHLCVVMVHNYLVDKQVLSLLLQSQSKYLGVLGPKRRTEKIIQELKEEGVFGDPSVLNKLHAPAGLDIGAEGPHQIALSILAEIQSVIAGRCGGHLKDRQLSIHNQCPPIEGKELDLASQKVVNKCLLSPP